MLRTLPSKPGETVVGGGGGGGGGGERSSILAMPIELNIH